MDKRTDIWAFGCVLYELLTGKQAFHGEDVTDILAAVVKTEPDWRLRCPRTTPVDSRSAATLPAERRRQRIRMRRARIEIEEALAAPQDVGATQAAPAARGWRERVAWPVAAGVLALIAIAFAIGFVLRAPKPPQPMRLSAEIGADASLYTLDGPSAILSPDGTRLALVATGSDQKQRIYVRSLDQLQATALSGTENARDPFFSPDGQWIGFFADGKLKKISVQGGAAVTLCDAPNDRGGSWGEDGTIVFAPDNQAALSKVSSAGGTPQPLTTLDKQAGEITQRWPQVLPGARLCCSRPTRPEPTLRTQISSCTRWLPDSERRCSTAASCPLFAQRAHGLYARRHAVRRALRSEAAGGDRPARADPRRRGHRSR